MKNKTFGRLSGKEGARRRDEGFPPLNYYGNEFVLNRETGMFYRVTATAVAILQALDGGADSEALVETIREKCAVDRLTAIRDIELLINELHVRGILTRPETARRVP